MAVQQLHLQRIGNEHSRLAALMRARGRATSVGGTSTVQEATKQIQKLKVWQKDGVEGLFLNRNMGKPQTIDAHAAIRRKKGRGPRSQVTAMPL